MKKELFKMAWQFVKDGVYTTFKDALKAAWNRFKLVAQLRKGLSYFQFKKTDGEVRNAVGTLRDGNFNYEAKGSDRVKNNAIICYWDVEKRAFRSLKIENFICFN